MKAIFAGVAFGLVVVTAVASGVWLARDGRAAAQADSKFGPAVQGRVVSAYGPVKNARVRVAGADSHVQTDRQGIFSLYDLAGAPTARLRVAAGKEGYFNNAQPALVGSRMQDIFLNPVPVNDHPNYRFNSPAVCARCHIKLSRYWDQSKMAHTTANPKVLQMYYGTDAINRPGKGPGYKTDHPDRDGNCVTCHAPSAAATPGMPGDLQTLLLSPRIEWDGISCDYCHKVRRVLKSPKSASGFKAVFERQTARSGNAILVFGPYDDVAVPPMAASYNSIFEKGRYCSQCHSHIENTATGKAWDWRKVYSAGQWKGFGLNDGTRIPVQTTYQEWKQWQEGLAADDPNRGKKCQDCHMSWRKEMLPYDHYVIDQQARAMWGTYRDPKNIRPHHFDGGTATQLKTALGLELAGEVIGKVLSLTVYVTNTNGGHWIPTGETMRSVLLTLDVRDESGRELELIQGPRLPDWAGSDSGGSGPQGGQPGTVFARVLQDAKGTLNVPFWKATGIASDSRIRPKTTVKLSYQFALRDPDEEPEATATLVYRPAHRSLAASKIWDTKDITITRSVW